MQFHKASYLSDNRIICIPIFDGDSFEIQLFEGKSLLAL
jgi:hypothetical protein